MIQPFKLSLKKYCLEMWALISWQKCIFAVFVLHNSQNDQLYASASSTSQETAFALDHQRAIHFLACQMFIDLKKNFNGRLEQ